MRMNFGKNIYDANFIFFFYLIFQPAVTIDALEPRLKMHLYLILIFSF